MAKYGRKSAKEIVQAIHEFKRGTLLSGPYGKRVTRRAQAIAIGLARARKLGARLPPQNPRAAKRARIARTSFRSGE